MTNHRGRCDVFNEIDALSEARTVQDLVRQLQPILNNLAYYTVTEGSVQATTEEWHDKFTDNLYEAAGENHRSAALALVTPPAVPVPMTSSSARMRMVSTSAATSFAPASASSRKGSSGGHKVRRDDRRDGFPSDDTAGYGLPPLPRARPAPESLPASLAAIMNGSHASFGEEE